MKSSLSKHIAVLCCILLYIPSSVSAQTGSSLNFDGYNNTVQLPDFAPSWDLGNDFTVEAWINPTTVSGTRLIFYSGFGCLACPSWVMSLGPESTCGGGGTYGHLVFNAGGYVVESDNVISTSGWTHVAATYNGSVMRLYINGSLQTSSVVATFTVSNSQYRVIGGDPSYWYGCSPRYMYQGNLDEIRTWNRALCASEITNNMNCEIPTNSTGLTSNYHFNQGIAAGSNTVTTLLDATSNAIHGTLNGFYMVGTTGNWAGASPFTSGTSCTMTSLPDIKIFGNGNYIPLNYTVPVSANNTEFGNVALGSVQSQSFQIKNNASGTLSITAAGLSGSGASHFSITTMPASIVAGTSSTSIVVTFSPSTTGLKNATLTLTSNDCDESPYVIALQGTGTTPASALNFDGVDDFAGAPNSTTLMLTNAMSLEAWVKPTTISSVQYIISKGTNDLGNGQYGIVLLNGIPQFHLYNNSAHAGITYHYTLTPGVWTHLAATWDGTVMNTYVNGLLDQSQTYAAPLATNTESLQIGRLSPFGYYFNGSIDEVRIWSVARSACDIQSYMNCEIPTTAPGLIVNYHFNQGSAGIGNPGLTTLNDASGSNINGTLEYFGLTGTASNWVAPGAIANGYTISVPPTASISVTGNSNPITNNSTTVTTLNFTDFGSSSSHTFVIQNSNTGTLNIGSPYLTGANATEFSLSILPSSTLAASATTSFVVVFTPTAGGTRSATVRIYNNDCNKPIFNFEIHGAALLASALNLDGVDDYVAVNGHTLNNQSFTIEFYAKRKSNATADYVYGQGTSSNNDGLHIGFYEIGVGNYFNFGFWNNDLDVAHADFLWHHWACVYDASAAGNNRFVYRDGILLGSDRANTGYTGTGLSTIGSNPWSTSQDAFDGDLDELRIWNRALCENEIQNNLNCEVSSTAPGLISAYHFNQGSVNVSNTAIATLTDATSGAHTGTLMNFASTSTLSNWVAPGAVTSGSACSVFLDAEINLIGNAVTIPSGAPTPTASNNTDFGSLCSNSFTTKVFTIQNAGTAPLTINSLSLTGTGAALFSVSALSAASPIAAGSTANFTVTLTPLSGGLKTATLTIASNDCDEALYTFVLSGFSNTLPIVSASTTNSLICNTATTSVIGSGADTYTWSGVIAASNGTAFNPSVTATYSVAGTNTLTACSSTNSASQTITVMSLPIVSISVLSSSICAGSAATLTAGGADQYTWTPGPLSGSLINPYPLATTGYTLTGTNTLTGCTSTNLAVQTVTVNALPTVSVSALSNSICAGSQATLAASGAVSYTWQPVLLNGTTINPTPVSATTYSVIGKDALGCISINTASQIITVNALPVVSITPLQAVVCSGNTASLAASGAISYTWMPNNLTGSSITPIPPNTVTYTLVGKDANACTSTNTAVQTITVNALPTVTASTSHSLICNSGTTSLIGTGADTYTWSPLVANTTSFAPTSTTSYTLSGTYTLTGCASTNLAVQTISVNPSPIISLSVISPTLCAGNSPTLTAANAVTYTWIPGNYTTAIISPTPAATTVFTLTGSSAAGCLSVNSPTQTITVYALPVVTASASNPVVCSGHTTSLSGSGAQSYIWTGGVSNNIPFTPSASSDYTVTGTDANGCKNSANTSVTVNLTPIVAVNITTTVVCAGTSITLLGSGAASYNWSGGVTDAQAFAPAATLVYTLTGTSTAGCTSTNSAQSSVTVNALPVVTASVTNSVICYGQSSTLSGNGANSYTWSNGVSNAVTFSPTLTTIYILTGEDAKGCQNTTTASIEVNNLPILTISSSHTLLCEAAEATLTASGASTYTWNTNVNSTQLIITPTISSTYSVTATDLKGCVNSASFTQSVSPCLGTLTAISSFTNVTCGDKTDGKISITAAQTYSNSLLSYHWSANVPCASNTCSAVENLPVGTYSIMVKATYTLNAILVKQDSVVITSIVIESDNGPCAVRIFNGISANGDGVNDTWTIENISEFPKNKVMVFNRWGTKVYEVEGYNNIDKAWPTGKDLQTSGSNTYFYIIDLGNGSAAIKGWIDLNVN